MNSLTRIGLATVVISALAFLELRGCSRQWREHNTTIQETITLTTRETTATSPQGYILTKQEYALFPREEKKLTRYEYVARDDKQKPNISVPIQDFSQKPQFHFYDLFDKGADEKLDAVIYTTGLGPFLRKIFFKPATQKANLANGIEGEIREAMGQNQEFAYAVWKHDQELKIPLAENIPGQWAQQLYAMTKEELRVKEFHKQWEKAQRNR